MELFVAPPNQTASPRSEQEPCADGRTLFVADLASSRAVKVPAWFTAAAALRVARLKEVEHLLVVDRQMLAGTVSRTALLEARPELPVARLMTASSASLAPETPAGQAWNLMVAEDLECLPVVRGPLLLGIIARNDLAAAAAQGCLGG